MTERCKHCSAHSDEARDFIQALSTEESGSQLLQYFQSMFYSLLVILFKILEHLRNGLVWLMKHLDEHIQTRDRSITVASERNLFLLPSHNIITASNGNPFIEKKEHLLDICRCLNGDPTTTGNLKRLYHELGLPPADLHYLTKSEPEPFSFIMACLLRWTNKKPEHATWKRFIGVLKKSDLNRAASKIELIARNVNSNIVSGNVVNGKWFVYDQLPLSFIGRTDDLKKFHNILLNSHSNQESSLALITGVIGLDGIERTIFILQYTYEYRQVYDGNILWINAGSIDSVRQRFYELAEKLGLAVNWEMPNESLAECFYDYFRHSKCLIIFADVVEFSHIEDFRPKTMNTSHERPYVVITSEVRDIVPDRKQILELGLRKSTKVIELVRTQCSCDSEPDLVQSSSVLPLGLQMNAEILKAGCAKNPKHTKKCTQKLEKSKYEWKTFKLYEFTGPISFYNTLDTIVSKQYGKSAIGLIKLMACLNPDWISLDAMSRFMQTWLDLIASEHVVESVTEESLKILENCSLIDLKNSSIKIPPLVHHAIGAQMKRHEQRRVLNVILSTFASEINVNKYLSKESLVHAVYSMQFVVQHKDFLQHFSIITEHISWNLCSLSRKLEFVLAEVVRNKSGLTESRDLLLPRNQFTSMDLLQDLHQIFEIKLGETHKLALQVLVRLGDGHRLLAEYEKAIEIYDIIIPKAIQVNSTFAMSSKCGKADALLNLKRYGEALQLFFCNMKREDVMDTEKILCLKKIISAYIYTK